MVHVAAGASESGYFPLPLPLKAACNPFNGLVLSAGGVPLEGRTWRAGPPFFLALKCRVLPSYKPARGEGRLREPCPALESAGGGGLRGSPESDGDERESELQPG